MNVDETIEDLIAEQKALDSVVSKLDDTTIIFES